MEVVRGNFFGARREARLIQEFAKTNIPCGVGAGLADCCLSGTRSIPKPQEVQTRIAVVQCVGSARLFTPLPHFSDRLKNLARGWAGLGWLLRRLPWTKKLMLGISGKLKLDECDTVHTSALLGSSYGNI